MPTRLCGSGQQLAWLDGHGLLRRRLPLSRRRAPGRIRLPGPSTDWTRTRPTRSWPPGWATATTPATRRTPCWMADYVGHGAAQPAVYAHGYHHRRPGVAESGRLSGQQRQVGGATLRQRQRLRRGRRRAVVEVAAGDCRRAWSTTATRPMPRRGSTWLGWTCIGLLRRRLPLPRGGHGAEHGQLDVRRPGPEQDYQVLATWVGDSNHASNAPFTVFDGSTPWPPCGSTSSPRPPTPRSAARPGRASAYTRPAAANWSVRLSDDANGYVVADAVRLVEVDQGLFTSGIADESVKTGRVSSTIARVPRSPTLNMPIRP